MTMPRPLSGPKATLSDVSPSLFSFSHSSPVCHLRKQFCQLLKAAMGEGGGGRGRRLQLWVRKALHTARGTWPPRPPPHPTPSRQPPKPHKGSLK